MILSGIPLYLYTFISEALRIGRIRQTAGFGDGFSDHLIDLAYESFCEHLELFRKHFEVKTICMHGSPLSKYDNRMIWEKYDYRELGIIGEPYFDVDFNEVLYMTDTGRRWDGAGVSVRDKIISDFGLQNADLKDAGENQKSKTSNLQLSHKFRHTKDIIRAAEQGRLPDKIMITVHPQRWFDFGLGWMRELVWQNVKNAAKFFLVKRRGLGTE